MRKHANIRGEIDGLFLILALRSQGHRIRRESGFIQDRNKQAVDNRERLKKKKDNLMPHQAHKTKTLIYVEWHNFSARDLRIYLYANSSFKAVITSTTTDCKFTR